MSTVVRWSVTQQAAPISTGRFTALARGGPKHFLTQPLGRKLDPGADARFNFRWTVKDARFSYTATRRPGC